MKRNAAHVPPAPRTPAFETQIWWLLAAFVVAIPLVITRGENVYRLPKELLFQAAGIIVFAACAIQTLLQRDRGILDRLRRHRLPLLMTLAVIVWTAIATAASTQKALSLGTLRWTAISAAFFLAALALAETRPVLAAAIPTLGAAPNAVMALLQRLQIWNPFTFQEETPLRARITAMLGNPNDLGGYLLLPILAAFVLALVHRGRLRWLFAAAGAVLTAGLLASATLTALAALATAGGVLLLRTSRRAALAAGGFAAVAAIVLLLIDNPVRTRVLDVARQVRAGNLQTATSLRLQSFTVAWLMVRDHPLTGVGPGCFGYWYIPYSVLTYTDHPEFIGYSGNFHDVHNDHLQFLATAGVPGYALFLAALWLLVRRSFGPPGRDARDRFARMFALPAAAGIAVLALGHFAFELAVTVSVFLYYAALAIAWREA
jgi:O-antigen ligase